MGGHASSSVAWLAYRAEWLMKMYCESVRKAQIYPDVVRLVADAPNGARVTRYAAVLVPSEGRGDESSVGCVCASQAAKSMCMWVRAMDKYARVFKDVQPKRERLQEAQSELDVVMSSLKEKQDKLRAVEEQIAELQQQYDDSVAQKKVLEKSIATTAARLKRASKLIVALGDEKGRWEQNVIEFDKQIGS